MDVCCTDSSEKGENQPLIAKMNRSICTNNGKILTSFLAPYRDRNCHFAKLMTKKDYSSFHTLYGARKEVKIFPFQLNKWTFAVQIVVKKEKINR